MRRSPEPTTRRRSRSQPPGERSDPDDQCGHPAVGPHHDAGHLLVDERIGPLSRGVPGYHGELETTMATPSAVAAMASAKITSTAAGSGPRRRAARPATRTRQL